MKTIWKFPVRVADEFTIQMPRGARLLSVQAQRDEPQLWALVDTMAPMIDRGFALRGTGHATGLLDSTPFVGTFQIHGGALVFHLFDLGES